MQQLRHIPGTLALLIGIHSLSAVHAGETAHVRWCNDINQAWQQSQTRGLPMLIFVTRPDCVPCARMKVNTYTDRLIAATLNDHFVAVAIDGTTPSPLLKDLAVAAYPVTFVVSPEAVILERIDGYVNPQQMAVRLQKITSKSAGNLPVRPVSGRAF